MRTGANANVYFWRRTNLVIILGMMQVAKRVPFDDPNVLNICRALYVASNLIILSIYLYIKAVIDKKKGTFQSIVSLVAGSHAGARRHCARFGGGWEG